MKPRRPTKAYWSRRMGKDKTPMPTQGAAPETVEDGCGHPTGHSRADLGCLNQSRMDADKSAQRSLQ